eukprot:scaffold153783_cov35-Tisochrysis_lutea.AAC.4
MVEARSLPPLLSSPLFMGGGNHTPSCAALWQAEATHPAGPDQVAFCQKRRRRAAQGRKNE